MTKTVVSDPARDLAAFLANRGYTVATGVPCSLLGDLPEAFEEVGEVSVVPATREDLAVGVAVGAALAGGKGLVMMQNSALGMVLNATQSLAEMYRVHVLLVTTWRGEGPDAPEHVAMGARMPAILEASGLPVGFLADLPSLPPMFFESDGPVCLVVREGELSRHG